MGCKIIFERLFNPEECPANEVAGKSSSASAPIPQPMLVYKEANNFSFLEN
jgi:hypothetical protein